MSLPPVPYVLDSGNGILDPARQVKQRVKAFSYVYRMSNDTKWLDRVWTELQVCYRSISDFHRLTQGF